MPAPFLFLFAGFCPSEATILPMTAIFIHGLDSISMGTKARYFRERFPETLIPDFSGSLASRMAVLDQILAGLDDLILVGSSFGGLMATIFTLANEGRVRRLILLAPALNFTGFKEHADRQTKVPAVLYIGTYDTVTPVFEVRPVAEKMFAALTCHECDDDHSLHATFRSIDWSALFAFEDENR
jgi:pimeloyl-ACP methyl ester carboxylesterase